jgi:hypothetical protein
LNGKCIETDYCDCNSEHSGVYCEKNIIEEQFKKKLQESNNNLIVQTILSYFFLSVSLILSFFIICSILFFFVLVIIFVCRNYKKMKKKMELDKMLFGENKNIEANSLLELSDDDFKIKLSNLKNMSEIGEGSKF